MVAVVLRVFRFTVSTDSANKLDSQGIQCCAPNEKAVLPCLNIFSVSKTANSPGSRTLSLPKMRRRLLSYERSAPTWSAASPAIWIRMPNGGWSFWTNAKSPSSESASCLRRWFKTSIVYKKYPAILDGGEVREGGPSTRPSRKIDHATIRPRGLHTKVPFVESWLDAPREAGCYSPAPILLMSPMSAAKRRASCPERNARYRKIVYPLGRHTAGSVCRRQDQTFRRKPQCRPCHSRASKSLT